MEIGSSVLTFFCAILQSRLVVWSSCVDARGDHLEMSFVVDIGCPFF